MPSIWTMGEILVEIMRPEPDIGLSEPGTFRGPFPSGAPAIFADTAARLGCSTGIIGGVGKDDFGRCILDRLRRDGVDTTLVGEYDLPTAAAFVSYTSDGRRSFIFHIQGSAAVRARFDPAIETPEHFHVMGCSLMADETLRGEIVRAVTHCADRGAKISFDPNIRPELLGERSLDEIVGPVLRRASILLPGVPELVLLTGKKEEAEGARALLESGAEVVAVKRGKEGACVYSIDEGGIMRQEAVSAYSVEEIDPTGAGDAFDAGFLCGLLEGLSYGDCARIAAHAGALNAAAFGPMEGTITRDITSVQLDGGR